MCDRKQDLQIITSPVDVLGIFCLLLGIHFTKHYRFECEFYRALCYIDRFVIYQIALAKFSKNLLSLIESRNNCTLVTRSVLGSVFFT